MKNKKQKISINLCMPTIRNKKTPVKDNWYIKRCLSRYFEVSLDKNPDYLIYSDGGNSEHLLNTKAIRIFVTGENTPPNWEEADYALTHERLYNERHWRLPLHRHWFDTTCTEPIRDFEVIKKRVTRFCNFIYSNERAKERIEFFNKLSQYKHVDSGGKVLNNIGGRVENKHAMVAESKFTIAFENESHTGYSTEKIIEPLLQGSIPIYWGDETIEKDFNPECFINVHKFNTYEEVIEEIKKIDNDDELWKKMVTAPIFKNNKLPDELSDEAIKDFFDHIFSEKKVYVSNTKKLIQKLNYIIKSKLKKNSTLYLRIKNRIRFELHNLKEKRRNISLKYKWYIKSKKVSKIGSANDLFISAGMQRSGSTLMFNILKELLNIKSNNNLSFCYINDIKLISKEKNKTVLLKTHTINNNFTDKAKIVVYTYRDVRTAMLSQHRKFNTPLNYGFVDYCIKEYKKAKDCGAIMIKYEELVKNPELIIEKLIEKLHLKLSPDIILKTVKEKTDNSQYSYRETLLHENHRTYTRDDDWKYEIDSNLLKKINKDFIWWFKECGYN